MLPHLIFLFSLLLVYATLGIVLFQRRKRLRRLQPPESIVVLRGPGESLRKKMEKLLDDLLCTIFAGGSAVLVGGCSPLLLTKLFPDANVWLLLGSGVALFLAGSIWLVKRSIRILDERSNAHLGWLGEQSVAEHLNKCAASGYRIFHDVPKREKERETNIDHVVVGPKGAVVIETKMRSKPEDRPAGEIKVVFDGVKISWPRNPNDTKTLWQVRNSRDWLAELLEKECGFPVPVRGVVAIPGWRVDEKARIDPRVVTGKGVADAVLEVISRENPASFTKTQIGKVEEVLAELCRDHSLME